MDEDEIIVTSPATITRSSPPSDNSAQQNEELNGEAEQTTKPTRPIKSAKDYIPPTANNDELEDDLEDFGFDQSQVKSLMSKRESHFDATMQRPHFQTREDRENERRRLLNGSGSKRLNGWKPTSRTTREVQRPAKKVKRVSGEGLVIEGSSNWILFDPISHEFSLSNGREPPAIFQKFMRYEPGNIRILEYNPSSECVRLKTTPESLQGKMIVYTNEGPKIADEKPSIPLKSQAPPDPPRRRGRPGRARKRGGRGGRGGVVSGASGRSPPGPTAGRRGNRSASTRTRATATTRPPRKSAATVQDDSGSESPLTDIEESIEVGDSQEGDSSQTSLS